jgi:hypothetical protein
MTKDEVLRSALNLIEKIKHLSSSKMDGGIDGIEQLALNIDYVLDNGDKCIGFIDGNKPYIYKNLPDDFQERDIRPVYSSSQWVGLSAEEFEHFCSWVDFKTLEEIEELLKRKNT